MDQIKHDHFVAWLLDSYEKANQVKLCDGMRNRCVNAFRKHVPKWGHLDLHDAWFRDAANVRILRIRAAENLAKPIADAADALNLLMLAWFVEVQAPLRLVPPEPHYPNPLTPGDDE